LLLGRDVELNLADFSRIHRRIRLQAGVTSQCIVGLAEARQLIEAWRQDYNQLRPHSSLGALAPAEYANQQGGGPPEQAQGSAARSLAPPPHLGQNINPGRYS